MSKYLWANMQTGETLFSDNNQLTSQYIEDKDISIIYLGDSNCTLMDFSGVVDDDDLKELLKESDWNVSEHNPTIPDLIKCISCGAISFAEEEYICDSCGSKDIHATLIGQTISISIFTEDTDLSEWCQDNSWDDFIVLAYDVESQLVWVKDCHYAIQFQDIE